MKALFPSPNATYDPALQQWEAREQSVDVLILGAGLAGTSLAHHLENLGYAGRVALLDCRAHFRREQRWCTWSEVPLSMQHLVSHRWSSWQICDERLGIVRRARCTAKKTPYQEIYAPQFFASLHAAWNDESSTRLHLNQRIGDIEVRCDEVRVETDDTLWRAPLVFDTRSNSDLQRAAAKPQGEHPYFAQTFLGRVVEFKRDVFAADCATLMDFRVAQTARGEGVHFAYVLPYSSRRALIETTAFTAESVDRATHEALLDDYIATHFGADARILSEESGFVPMTTAPLTATSLPILPNSLISCTRLHRLGVASGGARASSGYAFARIQQQTQAWARHIVNSDATASDRSRDATPRFRVKYSVLDEVFLQALKGSPQFAADCFLCLFHRAPTAILLRFLTDESSLYDDVRIIAALPKIPFLRAAAQRLKSRFMAMFQ